MLGVAPLTSAAAQPVETEISMTVLSVNPNTPPITSANAPLTILISLTNISSQQLNGIVIEGTRGEPLTSPGGLDAAIATPTEPASTTAEPISTTKPLTADLAAGASTTIDVATTTSITNGPAGVCICTQAGVYPLYFTAKVNGTVVGATQTYLPAFFQQPQKAQVTWIWPLIDSPHRLTSDTVFTDDNLADSVKGGRLDRALQTLETLGTLAPSAAVTVVLDPELLDELIVMADPATPYTIQQASGSPVAGSGHVAAMEWLGRLRTVLANDPAMTLAFTPFADPDLNSVLTAGLPLTPTPPAMTARISAWLGTRVPVTNLAWPVSGALSVSAARQLTSAGFSMALLGAAAVPSRYLPSDGRALRVTANGGNLAVISTPKHVSAAITSAISIGAATDAPQQLVAQVAVRLAEDVAQGRESTAHHIVLAPARYVDPAPQVAAQSIAATTTEFWTDSVGLSSQIATTGAPISAARLNKPSAQAPQLPLSTLDTAASVNNDTGTLSSLFNDAGNPLVTALPAAVQRSESSAWSSASVNGEAYTQALTNSVAKLKGGVFIVNPAGSYTLASNNSPLPLTIQNNLDYAVHVNVDLSAVNQLPGFSSRLYPVTVEPHSKLPIHVPATVLRSGRIQVQALLRTRSGVALGESVQLSVRSTALGGVGLIITIVSGAVLAIALLRRFWFRFRSRGAQPPPAEPTPDLATSGAAT